MGKTGGTSDGIRCAVRLGDLLTIETQKGTVTIECFQDNVPVQILKNGKVKQELTVNRGATSTRILAGEYSIEIDSKVDGMQIKDGTFHLSRGKTEIVRIVEKAVPNLSLIHI